jgi:tRNA 2-thiouridine synthesizing protein B
MLLHTINKSPFSNSALSDCLRLCSNDATIVLIEDGVYAALADAQWIEQITARRSNIYALAPDLAARGLSDRIASAVNVIDYAGFVELCCAHTTIQSWY